jgi:beta-lactamase regulating signal transducer with metallopeptidase domain
MPSLLYLALSNAILATLLAALVAVVTRFCRRPSVRHALWLLVLLKLLTPPLLPLSVTWPQGEEIKSLPSEPPPTAIIFPESLESIANGRRQPAGEAEQPADEASDQPTGVDRSLPSFAAMWRPALIAVWLGGALLWWTVAVVRLWKFRRLIRQARPAAADVQEQGQRLAMLLGLRRCPPIVFVSAPLSPMLWALGLSPRLLVPAELWRKLRAEQQDSLLSHELAHLRRGDHWVRRLELLVLGLYWWHPVVWWARRCLQEAEEECCDALVVAVLPDAAPAYASALVETVAFLSQIRPAALVGVSGIGHVPLLKRRLTMILTETSSRKPSRIGFWIVLGMGALLLPWAPQAARTEALEEPKDEGKKELPFSMDFGFPLTGFDRNPLDEHVSASCAACHDVRMPAHGFHGKPQSWREAHDEIVRLMDELRRRQAEFHEATKRLPPAEEPDRREAIEKLQDEVELLKTQVRIKEAQVAATKVTLEGYRKRLKDVEPAYRQGAVPQDTLEQVRLAVTTHEPQLRINEAELQESLVRLKQAERRLARLQPSEPRPVLDGKTSWNTTWAEALFDRRSHHMGLVPHGAIVERRFVMTNHGQRAVHIANIRTSDGCLKATASGDELAPGTNAVIQAKLDTSRFIGDKDIKIHIQFDKPERQEVVLEIHANSQAAVPAKPQSPERLQELEKKLDELRKEMDKMRREMRPDKPRALER